MAKNKKQWSKKNPMFTPQNHKQNQMLGGANIRKNNMNYTNINKNRGK